MGVYGGKYLGFSYAGLRSEDLGIIRTMQDRFEIPLTPTIKDTTTETPNYPGVYFWGSDYDRRNINIQFAFDELRESQLSTIKNLLNGRRVHQLIFDEEPEKIYPAVMTGQSKLDYVAFDVFIEGNLERVYRGTGNFQLVGYTPYIRSTAKFAEELGQFTGARLVDEPDNGLTLPEGQIIGLSSLEEVQDYHHINSANDEGASMAFGKLYLLEKSILPSSSEYGYFNGTSYRLFNSGDIDIPFEVILPFDFAKKANENGEENLGMMIQLLRLGAPKKRLQLKISEAKKYYKTNLVDRFIKINSKDYTVLGCEEDGTPTGTIYNECIIGGTFFNLQKGLNEIKIEINGTSSKVSKIDYRYLYH